MSGRYVRDPRTLWRLTLDAVVVLAPGREHAVVVPDAGPAVWAWLQDPRALDEMATLPGLVEWGTAAVAQAAAHLLECAAILELPADRPGD
jgi:hypothetical protein